MWPPVGSALRALVRQTMTSLHGVGERGPTFSPPPFGFDGRRMETTCDVASSGPEQQVRHRLAGAVRLPGSSRREFRLQRTQRQTAIRKPSIGAVWIEAKKFGFDERIQNPPAHGSIDAAQALNLFDLEPHAWHLEILGADTFDRGDVWGLGHWLSRNLTQL